MLINPHPADWKEALHESLRESQGFVYALVDGVHNEAVYQKLKKMDYLLYQPLYATAPSADEETLGLGPTLVQYSNMYRKRWDAILDLTNGRPALSIIVTPEPMDRLAARLIPWCVVDADAYTCPSDARRGAGRPAAGRVPRPRDALDLSGPRRRLVANDGGT
jgi:hypothetical protein